MKTKATNKSYMEIKLSVFSSRKFINHLFDININHGMCHSVTHRYHQISYALTSIHFVNPRFESDIVFDLVLCSLLYIRRVRFDNKQSDIHEDVHHQSNRFSLTISSSNRMYIHHS